jgi:hypothetical protein
LCFWTGSWLDAIILTAITDFGAFDIFLTAVFFRVIQLGLVYKAGNFKLL